MDEGLPPHPWAVQSVEREIVSHSFSFLFFGLMMRVILNLDISPALRLLLVFELI